MNSIDFGLVLNLHQPAGNLDELLDGREWEAKEILWALDRIPRSLWEYEDVGRVHVSLSGTLLETLSDPRFQERVYGIVDCGSLLWHLQNTRTIEVLGTAYYHPVLPLIPPADREEQIARWLGLGRHLFWRDRFRGFWPPELGFCMDLVPALSRQGYEWVIVDSEHVQPVTPMSWEELRYRPHRARGRRRGDRRGRPRPRPLKRSRIRHGGRLVHRGGSRTHSALRLSAAGHDRERRRQRRLVSQHHAQLELLERLLRRACRARARGAVGRYPAGVHQRLPRPVRRRRLGHGQPWCVEHGRAPRRGLRPMDRLSRPARRPRQGRAAQRGRARHGRRGQRQTPRPPNSSSRPGGGYSAPRPAATSTGARPGCSAATRTSTPPPRTLTMRFPL